MAQPERMEPDNEMPSLPRALSTNADLDAEWGNQVVSYLGALNGKVDNMGRRLEAKIDGLDTKIDRVRDELESKIDGLDAKIDGVNDNIERLFQRVYPNVDFE